MLKISVNLKGCKVWLFVVIMTPLMMIGLLQNVFFSKEAMLDFCVDYLNKLDLLSDYLNDIDLSSDQYLKAKQHFGKYFIINENEEWADKVLSLEEK